MTEVAIFIGAIVSAVLWMGVVAPVIARAFGVPAVVGYWRFDRKNQHLTRSQFIWTIGALALGVGFFLLFTVDEYLRWVTLGDQFSHPKWHRVVARFVIAVLFGALSAAMTAPRNQVENK